MSSPPITRRTRARSPESWTASCGRRGAPVRAGVRSTEYISRVASRLETAASTPRRPWSIAMRTTRRSVPDPGSRRARHEAVRSTSGSADTERARSTARPCRRTSQGGRRPRQRGARRGGGGTRRSQRGPTIRRGVAGGRSGVLAVDARQALPALGSTWRTRGSPFLRGRCHESSPPRTSTRPENAKGPDMRGLRSMRRRGLEPPPGYPGPGPQPGASTNSAIGAGAAAV
jgi:hypothetical protein